MAFPLLALLGGGASTVGATAATGATTGALSTGALSTGASTLGGLEKIGEVASAAQKMGSVGPALQTAQQIPGFTPNMLQSGAGGMDLSKIASRFGAPGVPGSVGGTSLGGGAYNSGMMGGGFDLNKLKKMAGALGKGGSAMSGGINPPTLQHGPAMPFSPFQFSPENYQFRRPIGF